MNPLTDTNESLGEISSDLHVEQPYLEEICILKLYIMLSHNLNRQLTIFRYKNNHNFCIMQAPIQSKLIVMKF